MFKLRISTKILISFSIVAATTLGLVGLLSYSIGVNTLEQEAFNKLTAVREMKASQIEEYFELISNQVITFSGDKMIIDAMNSFEESHEVISSEINLSDDTITGLESSLANYYLDEFLPRLLPNVDSDTTCYQRYPKGIWNHIIVIC